MNFWKRQGWGRGENKLSHEPHASFSPICRRRGLFFFSDWRVFFPPPSLAKPVSGYVRWLSFRFLTLIILFFIKFAPL